jgi:catechol 2,3-dioxygenase-like lactoylglutathione lyase family enzyme
MHDESAGAVTLHHTHLMASDLTATVEFWRRNFGAEVVADLDFSGSRNVFLKVGAGRLHFYDQPPNRRGPVNHLGVLVQNIERIADRLRAQGHSVREIKADPETGTRYCMVEGPDGVLIELFQIGQEGGRHDHYFLG